MYLCLFNAITDALWELEKHNSSSARNILQSAQQRTEEMYVERARTEKSGDKIIQTFNKIK